MSIVYLYEGLSEIPSLGNLKREVRDQISVAMVDHSYCHEDFWLKCWFESELTIDEKAILDTIVQGAVSKGIYWACETGTVSLDFFPSPRIPR